MFPPDLKVWWKPSPQAETKFILSNTTDSPVTVTVTVDGTAPKQQQPATIQLNPHQTRALDILRDLVGQQNGGNIHKEGGISITHSGTPGAVLARMFISEESKGFSSVANFIDPQAMNSSKWHGSGYRIGMIGNEELTPIVVARNIGNQPADVSGRISYTNNTGQVIFVDVPSIRINPNDIKTIDVERAVRQNNVPANITDTGFEFQYSTPKGSVVMSALSVSESGNHVFQVPLFDPQRMASSAGGYPWKADGDYITMLYIKNETDQPQKYTAVLAYAGGDYALGVKEIKPHQLVTINFRALRDSQTPDAKGQTIPINLTEGQIAWSSHGKTNKALSGRSHQSSLTDGVSSTYDCRNCCPNNDIYSDTAIPGIIATEPFNTQFFQAEMQTENCYGQIISTFPVNVFGWDSSNASIATIQSDGMAAAVSPGEAFFTVPLVGYRWRNESGNGSTLECFQEEIYNNATGGMEVRPTVTISVPQTALDGDMVEFSVSVQNGTPTAYLWSFEPTSGGNNPQVNFTAPTAQTTQAKAHWFAKPDTPCASFDSKYIIKVKVTFQSGGPITKEAPFTVNVGRNWGGQVPEPKTEGAPDYYFDEARNLWTVVGRGTLERVPSSIIMRTPTTSQFYNKTLRHEEVHVEQYATGILSDLYKIDSLMPRLLPLTDLNRQPLEQKVFQAIQTWRGEQLQILRQRNTQAEIEAHAVSDPIAPRYLFQLECQLYGQP